MRIERLRENPLNSTIYDFNEEQLEELKKSIELNGLLEPIVINKSNVIISGHRRYKALCDLNYEKVECRLSDFENESISLIELNRTRRKTETELLREAEVLKKEYKKMVKMGRPKKGEGRKNKNWSIVNVSEKLGVSTTKLKKLLSIKNYEPELLVKVDMGILSVEKAYQIVREKYIIPKNGGKEYSSKQFKYQFKRLIKKYNPTMEDITDVMNMFYLRRN